MKDTSDEPATFTDSIIVFSPFMLIVTFKSLLMGLSTENEVAKLNGASILISPKMSKEIKLNAGLIEAGRGDK